jgi:hypothetical protein
VAARDLITLMLFRNTAIDSAERACWDADICATRLSKRTASASASAE